jgi:hypothetical protein
MTTTTTRTLSHPRIPLSAPEWAWRAAGYATHNNSDEVGMGPYGAEALMLQALGRGLAGVEALAWVVTELARAGEERTRVTAQAREAEALTALAQAIRESGEADVLGRILERVSERTQYAIRQQLGLQK